MAATPARALTALRRNKVFEEVADRLRQWIQADLKPGDKLPPERELVERFGVSRSSVRDAIHKLQSAGFVETRHGVGTVVCDPSQYAAVVPLTSVLTRKSDLVAELMDVRRIIEPPLAARAALHATDEEIAAMEQILKRQADRVRRGEPCIEEDSEFHYAIALAAHNSIVVKLLDTLMGLLQPTREKQLQINNRPKSSLAGHLKVLDAIKRRDAESAESAMRQHIEQVEAIIQPRKPAARKAAGA